MLNFSELKGKQGKSIIFFYDYFYPGFKAGGPIQSLTNLALALEKDYEVSVVTTAYDLKSNRPYSGVLVNQWNKVVLPGSTREIRVYYSDYKSIDEKMLQAMFSQLQPDFIYLNGIFSYKLFLLPLFALRNRSHSSKTVICPRGMLKKGALSGKPLKKKLYLFYLKTTGLLNKAVWHATTDEEATDIAAHFPKNRGIVTASNIPKVPFSNISFPVKEAGKIRLVYLSLINSHKNLLLLLNLLKDFGKEITLDVYGPVIDQEYWQQCELLIKQLAGVVQYKGEVQPAKVQEVISQYHALILFTKGENFGHAIYESLSVGRPVITSFFTPWNDLEKNKAGVNVDIDDMQDCTAKISVLCACSQQAYDAYCVNASDIAKSYFNNLDSETKYKTLFS